MDEVCGDCGDGADVFMECCGIYLCEDCAEKHMGKYMPKALRQHSDTQATVGQYGKVLRHDGSTEIIQ